MNLLPAQLKKLRGTPVGETGNRVADAVRLAEISQADMARALELSQQYVSDVARGRYPNITIENARKFADFFGCAIEDLFPAVEPQKAATR